MNNNLTNDAEWNDKKNWRGGWIGIYSSVRDSRIWVPKKIPWMGWTLNVAHRKSWYWIGLIIIILLIPIVIVIISMAGLFVDGSS